jgi:hypothetical protein
LQPFGLVRGASRPLRTHSCHEALARQIDVGKNKAQLDVVLAPDWVDLPSAAMDHYFESFPDFTLKNEDFIVSGNKVVVRSILHATQRGEFSSIKPSGKPIEVMTIDIHEICNGKVVQTWHLEDWLAGMFQMGVLPLQK